MDDDNFFVGNSANLYKKYEHIMDIASAEMRNNNFSINLSANLSPRLITLPPIGIWIKYNE